MIDLKEAAAKFIRDNIRESLKESVRDDSIMVPAKKHLTDAVFEAIVKAGLGFIGIAGIGFLGFRVFNKPQQPEPKYTEAVFTDPAAAEQGLD